MREVDQMHLLDVILQQQIASDETAVLNLPNVLASLSPSLFSTLSHSHKLWIARISSLLERPKHPGARWAGFCLANRTAQLNRELLVSSAQNWINYALPTLSRDEPVPTLNAAIHLLATLYTNVLDLPEFHRQVVVPTAQKFSIALFQIAQKSESPIKLKAQCMHILTLMVHHHPNLHVAVNIKLHNLTLTHLSGTFPSVSDRALVQSAADLHSVLHLTGGKVRGSVAWRRSVDSAISSALSSLNEVIAPLGASKAPHQQPAGFDLPELRSDNYQMSIPIAVDRLRSLVALLISLLKCNTPRPVAIPIGSLVNLALRLMSVTLDSQDVQPSNGFVDPARRLIEVSAYPTMWEIGSDLLVALAQTAGRHLTPYVSQFASVVVFHLEQPYYPDNRLPFLKALTTILSSAHTYPVHGSFLSTRLLKALLPCLSNLLSRSAPLVSKMKDAEISNGQSLKTSWKKKGKSYDGDELFSSTRNVLLGSPAEAEQVLETLRVLPLLLSSPHTNAPTAAVASRLLLSLLLHLPYTPAALVSQDPSMHGRIIDRIAWACEVTILHDASNPWLRRGLGLLALALGQDRLGCASGSDGVKDMQALRTLSLLIHPQLPPTLRTITSLDAVGLHKGERKEERESREVLGLVSLEEAAPVEPETSCMLDGGTSVAGTAPKNTQNEVATTNAVLPEPHADASIAPAVTIAPAPGILALAPMSFERPANSFTADSDIAPRSDKSTLLSLNPPATSHSSPSLYSSFGLVPLHGHDGAPEHRARSSASPTSRPEIATDVRMDIKKAVDDDDDNDENLPDIDMGDDSDSD